MEIALHEIEPWLIEFQFAPFNLGESGVVDQSVAELLEASGTSVEALGDIRLANADTKGSTDLREAIASLYPGAEPENVLVTTGVSEGLLLYYSVRHEPGVNVVVPTPAFQSLSELPRYLGFETRELPLRMESQFRLDLEELEALVDHKTRVIVINTPQNPTGIIFSDQELDHVKELAKRHGAEVLADEHYRFIPLEEETELLPTVYNPDHSVVAFGSMIKCFGCVGLRVGWLIGPRPLVDACRSLKDYTTHTVCAINDAIATHALRAWRDIAPRYRDWARENVAAFERFVGEHPALEWRRPQGGLVAFPRLTDRSLDSAAFCRDLVEQSGVFLLPGETFGCPGHFRIGFGLPPELFKEALERMSDFVAFRSAISRRRSGKSNPKLPEHAA